MEPIIEIKNVGKRYNINHENGRYIALRDILANVLRNPFKFIAKKTKQALGIGGKEEFWALKGINIKINRGEIIGIIGHNGAGKSTLLKILTGITPPTTGSITMHGKVASLLEVGTGFHPELTGRENVYLNGAILGMTKKEIERKFDKIIEFSGVEKFIDTPVKRYSSGMYVRLAFSVAAHLEPDILLVDEVLAVGDSEFQKKSLGKLDSVSKSDDRTILFVSHNMNAIQKLCTRCILLDHGEVKMIGETREVIKKYLDLSSKIENATLKLTENYTGKGGIMPTDVKLVEKEGIAPFTEEGGMYKLSLDWEKKEESPFSEIECAFAIHNSEGTLVTRLSSRSVGAHLDVNGKTGKWTCLVEKNLLPRGEYYSNIKIDSARGSEYWKINAFSFTVHPGTFQNGIEPIFHNHSFHQPQNWTNE